MGPPDGSPGGVPANVDGFRRLGEDTVFSGHVFSVSRLQVRDPEGTEFDRSVMRHPGAVAVVAVSEEGTVTLVRQLRPAVWQSILEVPAGTRDVEGEPPEETARRELAEEAGLAADHLELLATVYNSPGVSDQETLIYLATGLSECDTGRSGIEEQFMQTETVNLSQLAELVTSRRLTDATTVLGLYLARDVLAGRS